MATPQNISQSDPARLSRLLELDQDLCPWTAEDLHAVLLHQLAAAIDPELAPTGGFIPVMRPQIDQGPQRSNHSFGDLLNEPSPPLGLLEMLKEFAKSNMLYPAGGLPREIATVLYYAAICAAFVRLGKRISRLPDVSLAGGIETALNWDWVDDRTRSLLEDGLRLLSGHEGRA